MVKDLYQKSFSVLMKRPFRLWGLSLLAGVRLLAAQVGFVGVPAVAFCAALLLDASMAMIYLNTYRTGLEPKTAYLFSAFRKERIWHVLGGMAWMYLWIFLWSLIPVVGIVFGVIRAYEYRFTPYILMTRDDVKPTEAIKVSRAETMGYKGKMFGADMLATGAWIVGIAVLSLLGAIPYLGVLFKIVRFVFNLAYSLLAPLFFGILSAAFYVEIQNRRAAAPQQPSAPVPPVIPVHTPETQPAQPAAPVVTEPAPEEAPETTEPAPEAPEAPQAPAAETNANTCPHCGAAVTAECVMRPTEMKSGLRTVLTVAYARMVSRETPPLISVSMKEGIISSASGSISGVILSSMMRSTLQATASLISSRLRHSTSMGGQGL